MKPHHDDLSGPFREEAQRPKTEREVNEEIMAKIEKTNARKRGWLYKFLCWMMEPDTGWPGRH